MEMDRMNHKISMAVLLLASLTFGAEIVLVDTDLEDAVVGTLPNPPFNPVIFYWDETPGCCEGSHYIAINDEQAASGTNSLKSVHRLVAEFDGASADVQIRIPAKYLPLSKATISLSRYVESIGAGVLTLTLVDDKDIGLLWRSDGSVAFRSAVPGGGSTTEHVHTQTLGTWVPWRLEFDFITERIAVTIHNDPIGTFDLPAFALQRPWAFLLGSNVLHGRTGNNVFYDDDIFASVVPLCDPAEGDCNNNGISDRCDIDPDLGGTFPDCNVNGTPDICEADRDFDGAIDACDGCPDDGMKIEEGICGCGISDVDSDNDETFDCNDNCPHDPNKQIPGICGCHVLDINSDGDGMFDCEELCPSDPHKFEPGVCGCGNSDLHSDLDGVADCVDGCPRDTNKIEPGICGCNIPDDDIDNDGTPDCSDDCPDDPDKVELGLAGCGVSDIDSDGDGTIDVEDDCPNDSDKIEPGLAGCGESEVDTDGDGVIDFFDECPSESGTEENGCNLDPVNSDTDRDGIIDVDDNCPDTSAETVVGGDGCELMVVSTQRVANPCGVFCGTIGMFNWTLMFLGYMGMRRQVSN